MIKFTRYPHVNDLFLHYSSQENRLDIVELLSDGIKNEEEAECLCRFAWKIAELINEDEENGKVVFGSEDNTEMLPDLNYELSAYMKSVGRYSIWQKISNEEIL